MTLFTELDCADGIRDHVVSREQFVAAVQMLTGHSPQFDKAEIEFLSYKYVNAQQNIDTVFYKRFYDDFQDLAGRSSTEVFGLGKEDDPARQVKDPLRLKVSAKYLQFYEAIEKKIRERRVAESFFAALYRQDKSKGGCLSAREIHSSFEDVGLKLTPKQVGQLVYPLHQDSNGHYSYCELVEYICGRPQLETFLRREDADGRLLKHQKIQLTDEIKISDQLKRDIEYAYDLLESAVNTVTDAQNRMTCNQLFEALKKAGVTLLTKDRGALENWFAKHKDKNDGLVRLYQLTDHFQLTKRFVNLRIRIRSHFDGNQANNIAANRASTPDLAYTFEQLVDFFIKSGVDPRFFNAELDDVQLGQLRND
jgi:hypothetical protein